MMNINILMIQLIGSITIYPFKLMKSYVQKIIKCVTKSNKLIKNFLI